VSQDVDITEVSDPQDLTIDAPIDSSVPQIKVLKGNPSDEELAALWGHPVDKLRYSVISWQKTTQVERTHIRR
jgi:hypothetical protein